MFYFIFLFLKKEILFFISYFSVCLVFFLSFWLIIFLVNQKITPIKDNML